MIEIANMRCSEGLDWKMPGRYHSFDYKPSNIMADTKFYGLLCIP